MNVTIDPGALSGVITAPSSKSHAHRLFICAALGHGEASVRCDSMSLDIEATISCLRALGASIRETEPGMFSVSPIKTVSLDLCRLNCGESGSTLRFMLPIVGALGANAELHLEGRLPDRPLFPFDRELTAQGMELRRAGNILLATGKLTAGEYTLPGNVSSQFITGLLFALPLLKGDSVIRLTTALESRGYVDMTLQAIRQFGIEITEEENAFIIPGGQRYTPCDTVTEGDWSQAGFWYAANALGSSIDIRGLAADSLQGDKIIDAHYRALIRPGDVDIDVSQCPDLVPPLAAMAAVRRGTTRLLNGARLRIKESDRLAAVTRVLNSLGGIALEGEDSLTITGKGSLTGGVEVDSHNDHRIAMMTAVLATRCAQPVTIQNAQCVNKSYPTFWEDFRQLKGEQL